MAKRKTPKVDLNVRPEKITNEQLSKAQQTVNAINRMQMDLGVIEVRKHSLLHGITEVQEKLTGIQAEFQEQYGTSDININDGTINYVEDGETDKKD